MLVVLAQQFAKGSQPTIEALALTSIAHSLWVLAKVTKWNGEA